MKQHIIGIMSGSSLDGIDLAYCAIDEEAGIFSFEIIEAACMPYNKTRVEKLRSLPAADARKLWQTHVELGSILGSAVQQFIMEKKIVKVDFVASHGHTIFHFPNEKFTTQIGDGAALAAACNLPVVCDFRSADVANGGTGAPIVPIADLLLFNSYEFCLNLGGIANISAKNSNKIIAYDVAPCNQLLDVFAKEKGKEYDSQGAMARSGIVDKNVLGKLLALDYHKRTFPKSLDNSFSRLFALPLLKNLPTEDKLRTAAEYIAIAISNEIEIAANAMKIDVSQAKILATGGGAFNTFLIKRIAKHTPALIVLPSNHLVKYKEALAMALMGYLRWHKKANVLHSVTGASKNTINGAIYWN